MITLSEFSEDVPYAPRDVFDLWSDPATWNTWDPDIIDVDFEGEPNVGAQGMLQPRTGPSARFAIVARRKDRLFTTASRLPGAALFFEHVLEPTPRGSRITVRIGLEGPLRGMWNLVLRKKLGDAAARNVASLMRTLEKE